MLEGGFFTTGPAGKSAAMTSCLGILCNIATEPLLGWTMSLGFLGVLTYHWCDPEQVCSLSRIHVPSPSSVPALFCDPTTELPTICLVPGSGHPSPSLPLLSMSEGGPVWGHLAESFAHTRQASKECSSMTNPIIRTWAFQGQKEPNYLVNTRFFKRRSMNGQAMKTGLNQKQVYPHFCFLPPNFNDVTSGWFSTDRWGVI